MLRAVRWPACFFQAEMACDRRGERWAWWALLISVGLSQFLSLIRAIALATTVGAGAPGILLAFVLLALLAGVPRMFQRSLIPKV